MLIQKGPSIKLQNVGVVKESNRRIMVWYESNCMITECFVVEESNWIITRCWCDGGIKLYTCSGGSCGTSNHNYNHRMFGVVENMKSFVHTKQSNLYVFELFFHTAEIFEQFDIGCFAILRCNMFLFGQSCALFAVLQVHQRAWSIIKYMASNHFSMFGTR